MFSIKINLFEEFCRDQWHYLEKRQTKADCCTKIMITLNLTKLFKFFGFTLETDFMKLCPDTGRFSCLTHYFYSILRRLGTELIS